MGRRKECNAEVLNQVWKVVANDVMLLSTPKFQTAYFKAISMSIVNPDVEVEVQRWCTFYNGTVGEDLKSKYVFKNGSYIPYYKKRKEEER